VVATPSRFHLDDLRDAIVAGKPVLVEKPLGHDAELAARLVRLAAARGVMLAVSHNLRFRPVVRRVKELLDEGAIGKPAWARFCCASWLPDWRPGSDYRTNYAADPETGGIIFDSIHEFDLAVHLLGPAGLRSAVAERTGLLDIASEDLADIALGHQSGCQTGIHLDYVTRPRQRVLEIGGPGGALFADLRAGTVKVTGADGARRIDETQPFDANDEYLASMKDFLEAASGSGTPACPAGGAVETLKLACAARSLAGLPQSSSDASARQGASH
jgi:predicted dehydrogenase